jgi:hypothetical protein
LLILGILTAKLFDPGGGGSQQLVLAAQFCRGIDLISEEGDADGEASCHGPRTFEEKPEWPCNGAWFGWIDAHIGVQFLEKGGGWKGNRGAAEQAFNLVVIHKNHILRTGVVV